MLTVHDVMTIPVVSVRRSTPLKEVAELLVDNRISGVPVLDIDGAVLGVVSEADLLAKEQGRDSVPHRRLGRILGESRETRTQLAKVDAVTAGDAMTSPAVVIESKRGLSDAAALMIRAGVNRLPVVDDDQLVGIVTRADLVRAYVRSDDELERTIRTEVLLRILWLDPDLFSVSVTNGIATIEGHVERRSTAEILARSVAMVPGIVDVRSDVVWSIDDRELVPAEADPVFPFGPR